MGQNLQCVEDVQNVELVRKSFLALKKNVDRVCEKILSRFDIEIQTNRY